MKTLSKLFAASLLGLTALTTMPVISTSDNARADDAVVLVPGQPTGSSGDTGAASSNPDTGTPSSNPDTGTPNSNGDTGAPSSNPDTGGGVNEEGSTP
ncbi:hypothetical protein [Ensifer adhaerens]|uniref:hypothetical protein n=1 Tax=Ensifer adhaerens TaxID=106592 RepID=UPI0009902AC2|nr:hypothetical protein [Ensifer adhaerens]